MEIEVAGMRQRSALVADAVTRWQGSIVEDGSLPPSGYEINTAPAQGDKFIEEITEICSALKNQKAFANAQCGLHVHIDCRNHNFIDLKKTIFLYQKIEPALYDIVAPWRRTSHYCRPCGDKYAKDLEHLRTPKDNENKILENVYGTKDVIIRQKKESKYDQSRYNALNLHSWVYRGTLENRMHHGTVLADVIINWGLLWASIVDYAFESKHTERQLKSLKGDSFQLLVQVAHTDPLKKWLVDRKKFFDENRNSMTDRLEI